MLERLLRLLLFVPFLLYSVFCFTYGEDAVVTVVAADAATLVRCPGRRFLDLLLGDDGRREEDVVSLTSVVDLGFRLKTGSKACCD